MPWADYHVFMDDRQLNHNKSKPKILVTGVSGYIGSHVAKFLYSQSSFYPHTSFYPHPNPFPKEEGIENRASPEGQGKYDVCGLTRGDFTDRGGNVTYIQGDFGNADEMAQILNDIQPKIIIHCAGVTPHQGVNTDDFNNINLHNANIFLNEVRRFQDEAGQQIAFINASTIGVYGAPAAADGVVREDDICTPLSPYAQSKYDFEHVLVAQNDVRFLNFRIANIPGRDAFLSQVINSKHVEFYGDAPYVRDYIHLDDLCGLFALGVDYLLNGGASLTINAGSGVGYSFLDLVNELEVQLGVKITRVQKPAKPRDVQRIICDISSAKAHLNWRPEKTNIKEIVAYALHNGSL